MFERFTEKAITVIMLAQEEARRLGHNFVGTEQILLGLIGEGTGVAAKVLKSINVKLKDARIEVEKIIIIGRGSGSAVEIPFTPRAKRVFELSVEEACQLGHNYIGTEHLLLGLIRECEGVGCVVLEKLSSVDLVSIRDRIIHIIESPDHEVNLDIRIKYSQKQELEFFYKCHHKALHVMRLAEKESRRLGHNFVGTEQILVGLIEEDTGLAAQVLKSMDVNLEKIRATVEQVIGHGSGTQSSEISLTPAAERLLALSLEEAQQLNHEQINTEHILLGIIRMAEENAS